MIKTITILIMLAKLVTLDLLRIKKTWNKYFECTNFEYSFFTSAQWAPSGMNRKKECNQEDKRTKYWRPNEWPKMLNPYAGLKNGFFFIWNWITHIFRHDLKTSHQQRHNSHYNSSPYIESLCENFLARYKGIHCTKKVFH